MLHRSVPPIALLAAGLACVAVDVDRTQQRVTNGEVEPNLPAVVALTDVGAAYCTGTLIGRRLVLTAAHCIDDGPLPAVDAGDLIYQVVHAEVPVAFDDASNRADLALLVLDGEPPVRPLARAIRPPEAGQQVVVAGYGSTADPTSDDGRKRRGVAEVAEVSASQLTLVPSPAQPCHGDSGGPILSMAEDELSAVVSWGDPDCRERAVATRIDGPATRAWIDEVAAATAPGAADIGDRCLFPSHCRRGQCLADELDPDLGTCSFRCDGKHECAATDPAGDSVSCASAGAPASLLAFCSTLVLLAWRRRR